ncbi:hypothetical protein ACTHRC_01525 [Neisseria sp. P0001.S009]|jgi:hypothetical protein|uniref:Uncharacterized protein n=1 Tax=Neisseria subflava TaxID=28449 RepID=A0AAW6Y4R8_NEISU|nr:MULTISPECIES: hypothetical protein [Neisseria]MDK7241671.1 hypothetical protein [Neisseria subflava]OHP61040.1 hypothetical protein HMPREF2675_02830 [Neisseria sp. HMSC061H08]DAT70370.1 MAG TPA: N-acetyltransferase [Bacteriophage sp.]
MCQNCIHKIEGRLSLKQHVHAEPCPKTSAPEELATAAVEVKFFGEELDLMESAACAANKSLSEFAAEAALEYAEMYLRAFEDASADLKRRNENGAAQHQ